MEKLILNVFTIVALGLTIVGCKDDYKNKDIAYSTIQTITKTDTEKFIVDTNESYISWTGFKPAGSRSGTLGLESGELTISNGEIESGLIIIDMNAITETKNSDQLIAHLKSPDFFDATQFPNATFKVTSFSKKNKETWLSGNLTLKDITHNISFPVFITKEDKSMTLSSPAFMIDRSKWNIKHRSKSFFNDLGDKLIKDNVELKILIKTVKE